MDNQRDRASGWKHAKLSGHENEKLIAELTKNDISVQQRLLNAAHITDCTIADVEYGGLCETDVDSILGGKTKSKTDMWLILSNGQRLNVSVKKDEGGQVFLVGIERFISGFEKQYNKEIPKNIKHAIRLYFGSADDTIEIINRFSSANKKLELRQHRLVADTLQAYDKNLYINLLNWFGENIIDLFDFCFARGLASDEKDWAQLVWYKNLVDENLVDENQFDTIVNINDLSPVIKNNVSYGTKNGGSTILLPFGFVQWHSPKKIIPGDLQFHHSYEKILLLLKELNNGSI